MLKRIDNLHLSFLVVIVSVLSLALIQQYALAQWEDPTKAPGSTISKSIVFNPMAEDLDLEGNKLVDSSNSFVINPAGDSGLGTDSPSYKLDVVGNVNATQLCIAGDCENSWPASYWTQGKSGLYYKDGSVGIGTDVPGSLLHLSDKNGDLQLSGNTINHSSGDTFYIQSGKGIQFFPQSVFAAGFSSTGKFGLATSSPDYLFHMTDDGSTAILNIDNEGNNLWTGLRLARDGSEKWFMGSSDADDNFVLRQNGSSNIITVDGSGLVGVNKAAPSRSLDVEGDGTTAIHGEVDSASFYAVHGENNLGSAVLGQGKYAVHGEATVSGGYGVYGQQSSGSYAGYFDGQVAVNGDLIVSNGYIQFPVVSSDPPSSDCASAADRGKAVFNYSSGELIICNYVRDTDPVWDRYERTAAIP